jgi:uncharacterized membrane protein
MPMMTWIMRVLGKLRIRWDRLAAAGLAGLLLHFVAVFAVTNAFARRDFAALASLGPLNAMAVLAPVTPDTQPLPFMVPDTRYAICRYDISKGPVVLRATFGDDDWSIALHDPNGDNVYVVTGADLDRREIELLLTAKQDGLASPLSTSKDSAATSVTVGLTSRTGIAIVRAPMAGSAFATSVERLLLQASCQPRGKL